MQKGNYISLGNRYGKILEIYHTQCLVVDLEETQDTLEDNERIKGIPLTDDILMSIKYMFKTDIKTYKISCMDMNYVLTRDWNEYPSYHIGIEYTDSSDPKDDGQIYNFGHDIKYLHQLQNILSGINNIKLEIKFNSEWI